MHPLCMSQTMRFFWIKSQLKSTWDARMLTTPGQWVSFAQPSLAQCLPFLMCRRVLETFLEIESRRLEYSQYSVRSTEY